MEDASLKDAFAGFGYLPAGLQKQDSNRNRQEGCCTSSCACNVHYQRQGLCEWNGTCLTKQLFGLWPSHPLLLLL